MLSDHVIDAQLGGLAKDYLQLQVDCPECGDHRVAHGRAIQ